MIYQLLLDALATAFTSLLKLCCRCHCSASLGILRSSLVMQPRQHRDLFIAYFSLVERRESISLITCSESSQCRHTVACRLLLFAKEPK